MAAVDQTPARQLLPDSTPPRLVTPWPGSILWRRVLAYCGESAQTPLLMAEPETHWVVLSLRTASVNVVSLLPAWSDICSRDLLPPAPSPGQNRRDSLSVSITVELSGA